MEHGRTGNPPQLKVSDLVRNHGYHGMDDERTLSPMTPPSMTQMLIILALVLLLFGATRLPKLARSLGESARIFKSEVKTLRDDDKPTADQPDDPSAVEGRVIDPTADPRKSGKPARHDQA